MLCVESGCCDSVTTEEEGSMVTSVTRAETGTWKVWSRLILTSTLLGKWNIIVNTMCMYTDKYTECEILQY